MRDGSCPICNADVPMSGDERPGETIYCAYCQAPLKVSKVSLEQDPELSEDF